VDLFADWRRRADFPTAVGEVIAAYRADGLEVQVDLRLDTFARLHVTDPGQPDQTASTTRTSPSMASESGFVNVKQTSRSGVGLQCGCALCPVPRRSWCAGRGRAAR